MIHATLPVASRAKRGTLPTGGLRNDSAGPGSGPPLHGPVPWTLGSVRSWCRILGASDRSTREVPTNEIGAGRIGTTLPSRMHNFSSS